VSLIFLTTFRINIYFTNAQNYRNEAVEADDMGLHARRIRALKSGRKKKERGSRADPKCESDLLPVALALTL